MAKIEDSIMSQLEMVIDPELQIDIVNLGLINYVNYDGEGYAVVNMTLTTMGCPLTGVLEEMINDALKILPEINAVSIELQWDPAWTIDRMSRYARMALGL